jgi:hypothetical protein
VPTYELTVSEGLADEDEGNGGQSSDLAEVYGRIIHILGEVPFGRPVGLARIGLELRKQIPGFDHAALGYSKFSQLMRALAKLGKFELGHDQHNLPNAYLVQQV